MMSKKTCACGGKNLECPTCNGSGEYWADEGAEHDPSFGAILTGRGYATMSMSNNFSKRR